MGEPLRQAEATIDEIGADEALVEVAGCGVCHTDLGYLYDGVPTRGPMPLVLGHEIAGTVTATGENYQSLVGTKVIVPAVMPCGECAECSAGKSGICKRQIFPGNDIHGGFASHVLVPARGLCVVPDDAAPSAADLARLAVIADAVTTPYNAVKRSGLAVGDVAIIVGAGGVGAFGVQIAKAKGAHVVALDVDESRLSLCREHGAKHTINVADMPAKAVKKTLREWARSNDLPTSQWKIFETSGTAAGQELAFSLVNFGATLMVVGFTMDSVKVRLSNLMAFEARAMGVWGCPPEDYPAALKLCTDGKIVLEPFTETHPLSEVNVLLGKLHNREIKRRVILVP